MYIHAYIHTYINTYIHTHTHTYTYIYIYTYIHTYIIYIYIISCSHTTVQPYFEAAVQKTIRIKSKPQINGALRSFIFHGPVRLYQSA